MNDLSFSSMLRTLSEDYYNRKLSLEEYRTQRKSILSKIDAEFNGIKPDAGEPEPEEQEDKSLFMRTISFFKDSDVGEG